MHALPPPIECSMRMQAVRRLPLDLQPRFQGACRLRVLVRAAAAVYKGFADAEDRVLQLSCAAEWDVLSDVDTDEVALAHDRARRHMREVMHLVRNCMGQRLVHAVLREYAASCEIWGLENYRPRYFDDEAPRSSPTPEVAQALSKAREAGKVAVGRQLAGKVQDLQSAVEDAQLAARCATVTVRGEQCAVKSCVTHAAKPEHCQCAREVWMTLYSKVCESSGAATLELVDKVAAAHTAASADLRLEVLIYTMRRLVAQNLQAIMERLWRPGGRLVQRREAAMRCSDEEAVNETAQGMTTLC